MNGYAQVCLIGEFDSGMLAMGLFAARHVGRFHGARFKQRLDRS